MKNCVMWYEFGKHFPQLESVLPVVFDLENRFSTSMINNVDKYFTSCVFYYWEMARENEDKHELWLKTNNVRDVGF